VNLFIFQKTNRAILNISIVLGFGIAISAYVFFYQKSNLVGIRDALFIIAIGLIISMGIVGLLTHVYQTWQILPPIIKAVILIGSSILALLIFLNIKIWKSPSLNILSPTHTLDIFLINKPKGAESAQVRLSAFNYGQGFVNLSTLIADDGWQYKDGGWETIGIQEAHLRWVGRINGKAILEFQTQPDGGEIFIKWDKNKTNLSLYSQDTGKVYFIVEEKMTGFNRVITCTIIFFSCLGFFWLFFLIYVFLQKKISIMLKPIQVIKESAFRNIFLLAFPIFGVSGFFWGTFFPAIMTPDSMGQWTQAITGHFNDWHPLAFTLFLWATQKIVRNPSLAIAIQIFVFGLLVAWGLYQLVRRGLPLSIGIILSFIYSLNPVNAIYSVTLWKDIPYGFSLLWLTVILFCIVETDGLWLEKKGNLFLLIICSVAIILFRHNGLPIPILSLFILMLIYRKRWRQISLSLSIIIMTYILFIGPVYQLLKVEQKSSELGNTILLHHIGAHLNAKTPIDERDSFFLNELMPLSKWNYECCSVNSLYYTSDLNKEIFSNNTNLIRGIFFRTLLQRPKVNWNHLMCSSSIVYSLKSTCYNYTYGITYDDSQIHWISNPSYVLEDSLIPSLIHPLTTLLKMSESFPWMIIFWRPSFAFGISILLLVLIILNKQYVIFGVLGIPFLMQTGIMFLINLAQDYRYHYGGGLILTFLFAVYLWTIFTQTEKKQDVNYD
jgi:hypothetical protein